MFKDKLKIAIADSELSQSDFAKLCGVSRSTVSKWLSGDSKPTKARRIEMAELLGFQKDYFEDVVVLTKKIERLKVKDVAKLMGLSVSSVQKGLIQGAFPWGYAIRTSGEYTYFINAKKFYVTEMVDVEKGA